jgi:AcrR family transcriptional regulator
LSKAVSDRTWQQAKSENTRTVILNAALQCFYERGFNNTTTEKVAREAGVSRGAMLHHFPSRFDLIKAAVHRLHQQRLELFEVQERQIQENAEHSLIEEGIDDYWAQLHSPLFTVWNELRVAARTDVDLSNILKPAIREFDMKLATLAARVFPDLALSEEFERANLLTSFLLEGMAVNGVTKGPIADMMVPWLKTQLRAMFADVIDIDRDTAKKAGSKPPRKKRVTKQEKLPVKTPVTKKTATKATATKKTVRKPPVSKTPVSKTRALKSEKIKKTKR